MIYNILSTNWKIQGPYELLRSKATIKFKNRLFLNYVFVSNHLAGLKGRCPVVHAKQNQLLSSKKLLSEKLQWNSERKFIRVLYGKESTAMASLLAQKAFKSLYYKTNKFSFYKAGPLSLKSLLTAQPHLVSTSNVSEKIQRAAKWKLQVISNPSPFEKRITVNYCQKSFHLKRIPQ